MNLHQFRFVQEAVRRDLNLTETAKALREVANLKRIGEEFSKQDAGTLSIATTHSQARYVLPEPVAKLRQRFPKVQVVLHQGTPADVARMLLDDVAEIGLATESLVDVEGLVTLPCYEWQHVLVVPARHPLASIERPTLEQVAAEPLITYHPMFSGRSRIDAAFAKARLKPNIALEAIDADVIKTYVRLGMGVGLYLDLAVSVDRGGSDAWGDQPCFAVNASVGAPPDHFNKARPFASIW